MSISQCRVARAAWSAIVIFQPVGDSVLRIGGQRDLAGARSSPRPGPGRRAAIDACGELEGGLGPTSRPMS